MEKENDVVCAVIAVCIFAIVAIIVLTCILHKENEDKTNEYDYIQKKVIEIAEVDMGEDCFVKMITYSAKNNEYQVKVINKSQSREITYTVMITNKKTKELDIDRFIERKKFEVG